MASKPSRGPATRSSRSQDPAPAKGPPRGRDDFAIVGIGASAGGLEACTGLVRALPARTGMAFILVQHLDPTHESLMVDLLSGATSLTVRQAEDGMAVEREHLYVIPPGTYLSVGEGVLHLSQPQARRGARLPFDFLLRSLAEHYGARSSCVVLSGTGTDGSLGLSAVSAKGGLVVAQDPEEAGYDGMPRSAIATGAVDLVLPINEIPAALLKYDQKVARNGAHAISPERGLTDGLAGIIELLRARTPHDFTFYKQGTLRRRVERRMGLLAVKSGDMGRYLKTLRNDPRELDHLAKDLLINVTSFFRDGSVFECLAATIIPDLVREHAHDNPIRVWIAGCSTGEEAYSLAILFHEAITAAQRSVKLQVFASDVDPDAVIFAREGFYPETIAADVAPARLARFFAKEDHGYRVAPELRASVVFTVQDVLADPPFSRLDLVSCRNLLIYLDPEAQAKVISLFHFALNEGGTLLLGSAETVGDAAGCFEVIAKPERLYRHVGRRRAGGLGFRFPMSAADSGKLPVHSGQDRAPSHQAALLAELCRRLLLESYAPAAVLINRERECLYSIGPTSRYLRVAPGHATQDVLAMVQGTVRTRLRSAIRRASDQNARIVVTGGRSDRDGHDVSFGMVVQPVLNGGEDLMLVCFVDEAKHEGKDGGSNLPGDVSRVSELERELDITRTELQDAVQILETVSEEQKAVNQETLSINEEYQSTNEELLTSKEGLQSLNEELTALNSQLQETLERQRTTSNDLQNVLYSTDVATLFLDTDLNIRFFTPATRKLFNVIPTDVGRPLADLNSLAADTELLTDARTVLESRAPIEHQIEARSGAWFTRRVLPYRTGDNGVEGVVITFADITERKHTADALEAAERQAQSATIAKSRFLAAASHDLRQPLQTLTLLQGLLAKTVEGEQAEQLVARLDDTLGAMSGMLNTLLDINQIEAGVVRADAIDFGIDDLLGRLRDEFTYQARTQGLALRVISCGLVIHSDPRLLEQMIRNLLSNALKYTKRGKVLLGCRRRDATLSVEVWDTGAGIPAEELQAIFEEYHQLDNPARERGRGLGLGLSIVQRLGVLLNHRVHVRSHRGKGSVFSIEISLPPNRTGSTPRPNGHDADQKAPALVRRRGTILIVEDDPEVCRLLEIILKNEGHETVTAPDGVAAAEMSAQGRFRPDLLLADYNLPKGLNGLELAARLRETCHHELPVIILTGDISADTLRAIARAGCVQLNKPLKLEELTQVVQSLLTRSRSNSASSGASPRPGGSGTSRPAIFVVDDDDGVRAAIRSVLEDDGRAVEDYADAESFLAAYRPGREACLLIDAYLPGMAGLDLLDRLRDAGHALPAIMITGNSDVPMAVQAMKAGAADFIEKPLRRPELLAAIERALDGARDASTLSAWRESASNHVAGLTSRQRQIMDLVLAGHPSKNIAADLGISQRTVENHRATIMRKTGSKSVPALARLALAAAGNDPGQPGGRGNRPEVRPRREEAHREFPSLP